MGLDVTKLSPGWFGAAASVAGAGILLVPQHRVLAGIVGGAAVLAIALYQASRSGSCCDDCAKAPPTVAVGEPHPTPPLGIPPAPEESADASIDQLFARARKRAS